MARKLYAIGWHDAQIADFFGVHRATIFRWPAFREELGLGDALRDIN